MIKRAIALTGLAAGALALSACEEMGISSSPDFALNIPEVEPGDISE